MINKFIEEFVPINGINQYFLHFQGDKESPIILFLHGGPGMPQSLLAHYFESKNDDKYTIVYYDQRGTGKTYTKNKEAIPTFELLKQDLLETVQYLKKKYNKEKVIILGHSFGSVLGTMFAKEHPKEVICFIGVGQVINTMECEKFGYQKLAEAIKKENNIKVINKLDKIGTYPLEHFDDEMMKKISKIRKLQAKYKLASKIDKKILKIVFKSPILELSDFISMFKGMKVNKNLFYYLGDYNLYKYSTSYEVPIYYIVGENDFQTPYSISEKYFQSIESAKKKVICNKKCRSYAYD